MALTASYIAACMMAKLRVGWTVAGCAPWVRTIIRSCLFHCTTWLTGLVASAIAGAGFAAIKTATAVTASNMAFISDLIRVDAKNPVAGPDDQQRSPFEVSRRVAPPPRQ